MCKYQDSILNLNAELLYLLLKKSEQFIETVAKLWPDIIKVKDKGK